MNRTRNISTVGKVILISILIIFYSSCSYDNLQPLPHKVEIVAWSLDSSLRGENKYLTNSFKINESLLLVANSFSIWNVIPSNINKSIEGNFIDLLQASSDFYPPTLTRDIGVSLIDKDKLVIYPAKCSACLDNQIIFFPPYSSSTTSTKGMRGLAYFYSGSNKGGYPTIKSKYVLVPFECEFSTHTASLALIKIDTALNPLGSSTYGPKMSLNSVKIINLKGDPTDGFFCAAYYDKFFLYDYRYTWRIDTLGNSKQLPMYPYEMFILNNRLFAMSINNQLYVSDDKGENWSLFATVSPQFANLQYYNIESDLYAAWESQLWKVSMIGNEINFTELNNRGLETNLITSINKCGKYAFVTTTSGLFYKDTAAFNTFKGE